MSALENEDYAADKSKAPGVSHRESMNENHATEPLLKAARPVTRLAKFSVNFK